MIHDGRRLSSIPVNNSGPHSLSGDRESEFDDLVHTGRTHVVEDLT